MRCPSQYNRSRSFRHDTSLRGSIIACSLLGSVPVCTDRHHLRFLKRSILSILAKLWGWRWSGQGFFPIRDDRSLCGRNRVSVEVTSLGVRGGHETLGPVLYVRDKRVKVFTCETADIIEQDARDLISDVERLVPDEGSDEPDEFDLAFGQSVHRDLTTPSGDDQLKFLGPSGIRVAEHRLFQSHNKKA